LKIYISERGIWQQLAFTIARSKYLSYNNLLSLYKHQSCQRSISDE